MSLVQDEAIDAIAFDRNLLDVFLLQRSSSSSFLPGPTCMRRLLHLVSSHSLAPRGWHGAFE